MTKKKTISVLLGATLVFGIGIAGISHTFFNSQTSKNNIVLENREEVASKGINRATDTSDFSSATELTRDEMTAFITSVTSTPSSHTVTVDFTDSRLTGYGNTDRTAYLVIDDDNFTGRLDYPFIDASLGSHLDGYTINISNARKAANVFVVPQEYTYGTTFTIDNNYIATGALDLSDLVENEKTIYFNNIVIPNYVTNIESRAFIGIPSNINIICQFSSKPEGWASDWVEGGNVIWSEDFTNLDYEDAGLVAAKITDAASMVAYINKYASQATGINIEYFSTGIPFMIGYIYDPDEEDIDYIDGVPRYFVGSYPLKVAYDIIEDGTPHTTYQTLDLIYSETGRSLPYDGLGSIGSYSLSVTVDIILETGAEIDYDSFVFYNIYRAMKDTSVAASYMPDLSEEYRITAIKNFSEEINIEKLVNYDFKRITTFSGYSVVSMNIDKVLPEFYRTYMSSIMSSYSTQIASGEYRIRYKVSSLNNADYLITYRDSDGNLMEKQMDISTPMPEIELSKDKGNVLSFIIQNTDGITPSSLRGFQIIGLTINMHLWNVSQSTIVGRSEASFRFGKVDVLPLRDKAVSYIDLNLTLILTYVIYTIVYAGLSVALFFFLKNRYKNDEFRRMKPKSFIKKTIIGFVGSCIVLLTIMSIIYRFSLFKNSVYAFNPSDVFVVLSGIVSVVIIGYFIKYLYGLYRSNKQRKEALKLKLNEDVDDDGTK